MLMPSIFGENLFDDFFDGFARPYKVTTGYSQPASVMKTDVKETEGSFELDIDMPGYKKEDVKAELKDGYLTITGTTKKETDDQSKKGIYVRRERYYCSCSRSFYVGKAVENDDIKAKFEDGVLKISVPKKEEKPKVEESKYISIEG